MRPSIVRLLATKVTFFTRPQCGLCENAKGALSKAWDQSKAKFDYKEVDITKPENSEWFDKYAFDVPVIHIEKESSDKIRKLMHRINTSEVVDIVDS